MSDSKQFLNFNNNTKEYLDAIFDKIREERTYQINKWGDDFDSKNTPNDWVAYIACYLGKAVTLPWDSNTFCTMLIKVATLCCAAVEWHDRVGGNNMPKRHYD